MDNVEKINKELEEIAMYTNNKSFKLYSKLYAVYTAKKNRIKGIDKKILLYPFGYKKEPYLDNYRLDVIFNAKLNSVRNELNNIIGNVFQFRNSIIEETTFKYRLNMVLDEAIKSEKKIAFIMAPIFSEAKLKDGYYRRIKMVDDILANNNYCRFYLSPFDYDGTKMKLLKKDSDLYQISYDVEDIEQDKILCSFSKKINLVYHHSVGYINKWLIECPNIIKIVDLHGALPEEFHMYGQHYDAQISEEKEKIALKNADYIVCVTNALKSHIIKKYVNPKCKFIIMPIFDMELIDYFRNKNIKKANKKPIVVYAGGVQKWQRIDYMQSIINSTGSSYDYKIYVPSPNEYIKSWRYKNKISHTVQSKTPEEIREILENCDYGFVLREKNIVNKVACPTKLIEYLLAGVIPVLECNEIGDFVEKGMRYITEKDLLNKRLPNGKEKDEIIKANKQVIERLCEDYYSGVKQIEKIIK